MRNRPSFSRDTTPPKIDAALQMLQFARSITQPGLEPFGVTGAEPRELNPLESLTYESALTTLIEYFNAPGFGESEAASQGEELSTKRSEN